MKKLLALLIVPLLIACGVGGNSGSNRPTDFIPPSPSSTIQLSTGECD